jgi:hypothetical protein
VPVNAYVGTPAAAAEKGFWLAQIFVGSKCWEQILEPQQRWGWTSAAVLKRQLIRRQLIRRQFIVSLCQSMSIYVSLCQFIGYRAPD